jgi:hypothetical protein
MKAAFPHIALAACFLFLPWYAMAIALVVFLFVTRGFFATFIWAMATDVIYGSSVSIYGVGYAFTIGCLVLGPLILFIRSKISW